MKNVGQIPQYPSYKRRVDSILNKNRMNSDNSGLKMSEKSESFDLMDPVEDDLIDKTSSEKSDKIGDSAITSRRGLVASDPEIFSLNLFNDFFI